jgi:hypothetical protein
MALDLSPLLSLPGTDVGVPAAPPPPPKRGVSFLEDLLPGIISGFSAGMAARQRDPEALTRVLMSFLEGKEMKRRAKVQEDAQRLREEREARLAEMAETNERTRRRTAAETERRAQATESRQKINDRNTLINTAEDNLRAMFGESGEYNPAALGEYINQQAGRVKDLGGDPAAVEAMLMALGTQMSQRNPKEIPVAVVDPEKPPASVPRNARVVTKPRPRQEPTPRGYTTTDEDGTIYRVVEDPRTGREISRSKVGKRPKTGGNDAIDKIIQEATSGGRGSAPAASPSPASKTPQVGAEVTIRGKKMRITKVYPNGRFDAVDVQ